MSYGLMPHPLSLRCTEHLIYSNKRDVDILHATCQVIFTVYKSLQNTAFLHGYLMASSPSSRVYYRHRNYHEEELAHCGVNRVGYE